MVRNVSRLRYLRGFFLIVLLVLFFPSVSGAISQLTCLEKSGGKLLQWRSQWQSDGLDENVLYKVIDVKVVNRIPDRIVTLKLKALTRRAAKKRRSVIVEAEDTARPFCERLKKPGRTVKTDDHKRKVEDEATDFITYTAAGWVRADAPRGSRLVECEILSKKFLCLEEHKKQFGSALEQIADELLWQVQ